MNPKDYVKNTSPSPPPSSTPNKKKKPSQRKTKAEKERDERLKRQKDFTNFLEKNK